jgi:hypothetical protein
MMLGPEWPYRVTLDREDWEEIQNWCLVNIGDFDQFWYKLGIDPLAYMVGDRQTTWFFKREEDAIMFTLKWR